MRNRDVINKLVSAQENVTNGDLEELIWALVLVYLSIKHFEDKI
jgi:hypothetical protein